MSTTDKNNFQFSTLNFQLKEFACKDDTAVPLELQKNVFELMQNLQVLRDYTKIFFF